MSSARPLRTCSGWTAYTLALGVVVPVTAWLGDRFGLGRVYTLTLLGFAAASAHSSVASAFNNVVRNVAAALGVAGLTAILTIQQAQQLTGPAELLPGSAASTGRG